ncbi:MAG: hypothetical protein WKF89_01495 [Chitinophagaceae bacterium]
MKKALISFACLLLIVVTSRASLPNDKVLKSFMSTFNSPLEVKWFEHPNYYEVSFVQSEVRANVKYDLQGNFLGSTRYYKEQQLPTNILCKLKKKYADKIIFGVTELTSSEEVNYYVKIEDSKNWFTIKVNGNGQMEIFEKYKKV